MKSGQVFWGIFFVALGALILLTKYDVLLFNFDYVWDLWPLILVFIGLMVIARKSKIRPVIYLLFGFLVAFLVYGTFYNIFNYVDFDEKYDYYQKNIYSEKYDDSEYAKLEVEAGAGTFTIKDTTHDLIKGIARGPFADYNFYAYNRGNTTKINFDLRHTSFSIFKGNVKNFLDIELNKNPIWDLKLDIGAAKAKFDLTRFKVRDIELNTGATDVKFRLGDLYDYTDIHVEMGAASLEFDIPKNSGCRLTGQMFLISKDIPGFIKKSKKYYVTPNYDEAANKIDIDIQGGISSLEIHRY